MLVKQQIVTNSAAMYPYGPKLQYFVAGTSKQKFNITKTCTLIF